MINREALAQIAPITLEHICKAFLFRDIKDALGDDDDARHVLFSMDAAFRYEWADAMIEAAKAKPDGA